MTLTLILKLDLDIVKMYHHTKNEVSMSTGSKVIAEQTHTQIDTHTDTMKTLPLPHTREVKMSETWKFFSGKLIVEFYSTIAGENV